MTFDDQLRRTFDSLAERLREETQRQLATLTTGFSDAIESERAAAAAQAATEARSAAEQEAAERLTAAIAAVEAREREAVAAAVSAGEAREREAIAACVAAAEAHEREALGKAEIHERDAIGAVEARAAEAAREAGRVEGRTLGMQEGLKEGRREGRIDGRMEGRQEGREEGWLEGHRAGHELGVQEGRQGGKEEGRQEGKQQGLAEGREQGRQEGLAEGREEGLREGRQEAGGAAKVAALAELTAVELAANGRLVEAIRAIDAARSLTAVLDSLASSAGREVARVAVLIVRSGQLRVWRFIGFDRTLAERHDVDVPTDEAGVIAKAARTGIAMSADSSESLSVPSFAKLPPGRELLAVPVQMSGQVIAVLYADQGATESASNLSWPTSLEVMARHAARCLEGITAYRAAQVLTERPDLPAVKDPAVGSRAVATDADDAEDDVQAARRYARLLVSEIKLYHETKVIAGRRERDLATRLGGEIARARVLYEQRVPSEARLESDYFHEELVRTLANGDASLLELKN